MPPSERTIAATCGGSGRAGARVPPVGAGPELVGIASTYWSIAETPCNRVLGRRCRRRPPPGREQRESAAAIASTSDGGPRSERDYASTSCPGPSQPRRGSPGLRCSHRLRSSSPWASTTAGTRCRVATSGRLRSGGRSSSSSRSAGIASVVGRCVGARRRRTVVGLRFRNAPLRLLGQQRRARSQRVQPRLALRRRVRPRHRSSPRDVSRARWCDGFAIGICGVVIVSLDQPLRSRRIFGPGSGRGAAECGHTSQLSRSATGTGSQFLPPSQSRFFSVRLPRQVAPSSALRLLLPSPGNRGRDVLGVVARRLCDRADRRGRISAAEPRALVACRQRSLAGGARLRSRGREWSLSSRRS